MAAQVESSRAGVALAEMIPVGALRAAVALVAAAALPAAALPAAEIREVAMVEVTWAEVVPLAEAGRAAVALFAMSRAVIR